ncbi:tRNA preQ1(34) S-adenosylmethionine ribosyltransferase-isomerase QueA [Propylenella binzhouense]|uniref:S-adenosylmethionine:tRNA ribosyltransferase-isomerase n=1 Tax=Propylenella binzhouense TaxID=2555902 RepID=A0A964WSX4_9HYPH|nr:tRNA preQ1(34) S-adenosylmethionine ribosyltransferase-isomerase QueA [Propylenella binzhouense]MYZ47346.1 tRNA preQ1(34) S-adenosylmethionine ribosyltransferase-isomerase QueA [Propylenella binzhouense]
MRLDAFDFDLPEERIALRPARPRDAARLLVVAPERPFEDRTVADLPSLLRAGDVLVFNDTKVIPAQLAGRRHREGAPTLEIGVTLADRLDEATWLAFAKPGRRLAPGDVLRFGHDSNLCLLGALEARVEAKEADGRVRLAFNLAGAILDEAVALLGAPPLPPYIAARRPADADDRTDYQTVYAREAGAVAAPTAGLHFTPALLARLAQAGIGTEFLTLHVGPGTFLPVKADDVREHRMHSETGVIRPEAAARLNAARAAGGRLVAVGTTSLRLLESAAGTDRVIRPFSGATDIFITPGYRFRAVDLLMTNFHLPRSTLFMLVAAFSGLARMQAAYAHAVADGYRFYSYGDACLLHPDHSA